MWYCPVDGPPTNVHAVTLSPRSIEVTWDPPVANVDDVTGYVISYDGVERFADDGSETVDQSRTSTTINGLQEFVRYDITVQAVYKTITVSSSMLREMTWSDRKWKWNAKKKILWRNRASQAIICNNIFSHTEVTTYHFDINLEFKDMLYWLNNILRL